MKRYLVTTTSFRRGSEDCAVDEVEVDALHETHAAYLAGCLDRDGEWVPVEVEVEDITQGGA